MKYDVCGIGNALVDMEFSVSDEFITSHGIEKAGMTLVDEARQTELMTALGGNMPERQCGGSAANTIIAVSQFGGNSFYQFKVANDDGGKFYLADMKENGVGTSNEESNLAAGVTGKCMVMVTPDAERTMNTYLGITETLSDAQVSEAAIKDSKWLYMEGYLVTSPTGHAAALKAKAIAEANGVKTALTFSDPAMVQFFADQMKALVESGLDLVFCNEVEAMQFTGAADIPAAKEALKAVAKGFVITLGDKGAVAWDGEKFYDIVANTVEAKDTNGAGDMFAGAFLYGITNGMDYAQAGALASKAASQVVSKFGPRLTRDQAQSLL